MPPTPPAPGDRVDVTVRVRALERRRLGSRLAITGRVGDSPLRLWPKAEDGAFSGSFVAGRSKTTVSAAINEEGPAGVPSSALVNIDPHPREIAALPLAALAESHKGVNVTVQNLTTLERHLRDTVPAASATTTRRPMRSAWWFVAFAACLSGEWWQRRRRGAR